jgi:hypothetical protein
MAVYGLILFVAVSRLLPHPPNFACIGALALFAGYNLRTTRGFAVPLLALLLSDVLGHALGIPGMGFYGPMGMLFVYGGFAAVAGLGRLIASMPETAKPWRLCGRLGTGAVAGSSIFFLLSNLGVYLGGAYGLTLAGLIKCYVAAIPFFWNTLAGDLFFGVLLFGSAATVGKLHGIGATQPDFAVPVRIAD